MYIYFDGTEGTEIPETHIDNRLIRFHPYLPINVPTEIGVRYIKKKGFHSIKDLKKHIESYNVRGKFVTVFIRDEGIGDVLMTTPAIKAYKEERGCLVYYVTNKNYKILLENNPYVDKIIPLEQLDQTTKMLKDHAISEVIDWRWHSEHSPNRHKVHRIFTYPEKTGVPIKTGEEKNTLNIMQSTLDIGERILQYNPNYRYIVIQPSATHYCRNWDIRKWELLMVKLINDGYKVAVIDKGRKEFDYEGIINLTGETSVEDSIGVIAKSDMLVSVDTGAYHIAGTLGIPFVALFGIISPKLRTEYYSCWHKDLTARMDCIGCGDFHMDKCKVTGDERAMCMDKITVDEVYNAIKEYFNNSYKRVIVKPYEKNKDVVKSPVIAKSKKMTLAMITLNEEKYLPRLMDNLFGNPVFKRIVVIDGGSTDKTKEILERAGAEVYTHPWKNDYHDMVALQRNIMISYIPEGERMIFFDPDEIASKVLLAGLQNLADRPEPYISLSRRTFRSYKEALDYYETGEEKEKYLNYPDFQPRVYTVTRFMKFFRSPHHITLNVGNPVNVWMDILHYEKDVEADNKKIDKQWRDLVEMGKKLGLESWYK